MYVGTFVWWVCESWFALVMVETDSMQHKILYSLSVVGSEFWCYSFCRNIDDHYRCYTTISCQALATSYPARWYYLFYGDFFLYSHLASVQSNWQRECCPTFWPSLFWSVPKPGLKFINNMYFPYFSVVCLFSSSHVAWSFPRPDLTYEHMQSFLDSRADYGI